LRKVKNERNEQCIYRGNNTEDEGMLRSERLTAKNMTHAPIALMTLG